MHRATPILVTLLVSALDGIALSAPPYGYTIQSLGSLTAETRGPYDYRTYSLNDEGTVLGQTEVNGETEASIWQNGQITSLGVWPGGGSYSYGFAIDDNGDVAAELNDRFNNIFAAVKAAGGTWTSGAYSSAVNYTTPRGINSSGQLVGIASDSGGYNFPTDSMFHPPVNGNTLPILLPNSSGATASAAFSISNNGFIAGNIASSVNAPVAAVWERITDTEYGFETLDTAGSTALDVNNLASPALVGYSSSGATEWNLANDTKTVFLTSGVATGISDSGIVVGDSELISTPTDSNSRAFVAFPGQSQVFDLTSLVENNPGWTLYSASAINADGQIVGYGSEGGYLLTPAPEPASSTAVLVMGAFTRFFRRRRWRSSSRGGS